MFIEENQDINNDSIQESNNSTNDIKEEDISSSSQQPDNKTSVLATAVVKVNDFYKSSYAFVFFMSTTTIFAFVQVILYSLGTMPVNGFNINDLDGFGSFINWTLLAVSIIGCYAGFIGGILLFRGSLSFVFWQSLATGLGFITQVIAHMWFGAMVAIYFLVMNFIRYNVWKNGTLEKWNLSSNQIYSITAFIFILMLLTFNGFAYYFGDWMYAASAWMTPLNHQFDASGAAFNITATILLLFKNRWAFVLYALGKFFTIWNYADAGLIVPIVQMLLFLVMDITGFIGWSIHAVDEEETAMEVEFE